jgi:hypothetical protein
MADVPKYRPTRQRKPTIPFDERYTQSSRVRKGDDDVIQLLCDQTKTLDIEDTESVEDCLYSENEQEDRVSDTKAKKKAKAEEIARLKKLSLEDIIKMIPDKKDVIFKPFSPGLPRDPEVHIPDNINATDPLALLDLFIPSEMYDVIAKNTNLYATVNNAPTAPTSTNRRYWWPTNANEIRVFYGIFYYMGVHRESNYEIYWESERIDGPSHSIGIHMTLARFESLRRYIHVSEPTQLPPEPRTEEEEEKLPTETLEKLWWWKLEPLLSTFRAASQRLYTPRTEVAIDEIMVRFYGRSSDTCKMPNKPIKQGYKIFALADRGYVWHFQLSSRRHGIAELVKDTDLTPTGSMVLQMARLLPKFEQSHFILFLDNYFTSIPLFSMLRAENIGAVGTTRPQGTEFPALLIALRQKWSTKLDWGTICAIEVNGVLCIGWQDNNLVLGLTTIHTVHEASSMISRFRKRPQITSTNAATARKIFGDLARMELDIPVFIDDYNHNMNGVDLANQFRQPYDTQRISYRIWFPLMHWIFDQAATNAYILAITLKTWPQGHLEFRRAIYTKLLVYSKLVKPQVWRDPGPHKWITRPTRQACVWCSKIAEVKRKLQAMLKGENEAGIQVLKELELSDIKRPSKSWAGCGYCEVPLCKTGVCWTKWHSQNAT